MSKKNTKKAMKYVKDRFGRAIKRLGEEPARVGSGWIVPQEMTPHKDWIEKRNTKAILRLRELLWDENEIKPGLEIETAVLIVLDEALKDQLTMVGERVGEKKYTFKKVDWGDGLTSIENEQDDTKSRNYCEGYNQAIDDLLSQLTKEIE